MPPRGVVCSVFKLFTALMNSRSSACIHSGRLSFQNDHNIGLTPPLIGWKQYVGASSNVQAEK